MGHQSRLRKGRKMGTVPKKPEVIHRKQLFDGKQTAEEVHRSTVYAGKKCPCGLPPATRAISFATVKDLMEKDPLRLHQIGLLNGGQVPMVEFNMNGTPEKFVRIGEQFACDLCRSTMEKVAAKLPSWVFVQFDATPGPEKPIVQVPS